MPCKKLCVFCTNWYFQPGEECWSEETPGSDYDEGCYKGHWNIDDIATEEAYRNCIKQAETCVDYNLVEETEVPE